MRITKLIAENVKRIKAIKIEPDGNLVVIQGRNGQGKTSVLDSIWLAIQGAAASKETPDPIRHGETKAMVEVSFGDLVVTRHWSRGKASRLELRDAGVKQRSPQKLLDALVGRLSFDPLAFAGLKEAEQRAALLELVQLPFDPLKLDRRRSGIFSDRTDLNRDVRKIEGQLGGLPEPEPWTPKNVVSVSELLAKHGRATKAQLSADRLRVNLARACAAVRDAQVAHAQAEEAVRGIPDELQDPVEIQKQIDSAEETNAAVRAAANRRQVEAGLESAKAKVLVLTDTLDAIDSEKEKGLREAKMPVPGLSFTPEGVTYNGVPFRQCCSAERLRVSTAMAMAINPEIRVIRITDGSLLDSENMRMLEDLATEKDYQVWVECVSDGDGVGIVIEDGEVAKGALP